MRSASRRPRFERLRPVRSRSARIAVMLVAVLTPLLVLAPPAHADVAWSKVRHGERSENVKAVQWLLEQHKLSTDKDGSFGDDTAAKVKTFQSSKGLEVDAVVGEKTWQALIIKLRQGDSGAAVSAVQVQLNSHGYGLGVDGDFGAATNAAVREFQDKRGLTVDGVVGPDTWRHLSTMISSGGHALPVPRGTFSRGEYDDPHHDYPAVDLPTPTGTKAYAVVGGTARAHTSDGCGNGMKLTAEGAVFTYCHLSSRAFLGERSVQAGTLLGYTGNTGNSTGPHLHIEIRTGDTQRCPGPYLLAIYDGKSVPAPTSLPTSGCSY